MISFNDFVHKYIFKKATSNIKTRPVLGYIGLHNVGIYLGDRPFSSGIGNVNIQASSKVTHWVAYINENFFLIAMVVHLLKN